MPNANFVSHNTLLSGFFNAGLVPQALQAFSSAPTKDSHSWNILISGCVKNRRTQDAISHFMEMRLNSDLKPDDYTYYVLLSVCDLSFGCQIHAQVVKSGHMDDALWLIMKCSRLAWNRIPSPLAACLPRVQPETQYKECAFKIFQSIPKRDIVVWNGIICESAQNGEAAEALKLYNAMMRSWPSAISPNHHATFVDVLVVTVGCEAEALLLQMPFEADSVMWSTLLGACMLHRNLTMAKRIYEHLHIKGPWSSSNYVILANSYALMDLHYTDKAHAVKAILPDLLIANEIVHYIKECRKSKGQWVTLKVDLHKAYDKVTWDFLRDVLQYMNFLVH
ncbi:pentatricopeptide repeat-containing protein [Senna tora]|uniref:Pentatricopeptide repeat-containing protein n=1 Tax=Senna tora TaxID=362788 RepID=A0A835C610_9FABA|nr:pentatricopeptide repeat-containing protein [Senna tora]